MRSDGVVTDYLLRLTRRVALEFAPFRGGAGGLGAGGEAPNAGRAAARHLSDSQRFGPQAVV